MRREEKFEQFLRNFLKIPVVAKAYSLCHRTNQLEHDWTARIRCAQALAWCLVWVKWSTVGLMWEGGVQEEQHLASAEENTSNKHMICDLHIKKSTYSGIHCAYCAYTLWFWMSLVPSLRFVFDLKTRIKIGIINVADTASFYELHNLCHEEATMATSNGTKRQTPMQYNMAPQQSTRCNATCEMQARCVHLSNKLIQQTKVGNIQKNKYIIDYSRWFWFVYQHVHDSWHFSSIPIFSKKNKLRCHTRKREESETKGRDLVFSTTTRHRNDSSKRIPWNQCFNLQ